LKLGGGQGSFWDKCTKKTGNQGGTYHKRGDGRPEVLSKTNFCPKQEWGSWGG